MMGKFGCKIAILEILIITGLKSDAKLLGEDKTWTQGPGPWTPCNGSGAWTLFV